MLTDSKCDVPDVTPFPEWVSCVNIPNVVDIVQLAQSKMADATALSSDEEEPVELGIKAKCCPTERV